MRDFFELLEDMKLNPKEIYGITRNKKVIKSNRIFLNIFAAHAVLVVEKSS